MIIKYNEDRLARIIDDIFILTGISISVLDTDYNNIVTSTQKQDYCLLLQTLESEQKYCARCDNKILNWCRNTKRMECHICRTGLYDFAMPIIKYNTIVGFVIMGQVRSVESPLTSKYVPDTDSNTLEKLNSLYSKTPFMTERQLLSLCDLLPNILFDDAIEIIYDPFIDKAVEFIDANLNKKISINELCERFHISKNYLYATFRNNLNNTVCTLHSASVRR